MAALPACETAGGALGLPLGLTLGTYDAAAAESLAKPSLPACETAGGALGLPLGLTLGTYGAAAAESLATLAKSSLPPHRRAEQAKRSPRASPDVSHACGYTIEDDKGLGSD